MNSIKHMLIIIPGWSTSEKVWESVLPGLEQLFEVVLCSFSKALTVEDYEKEAFETLRKCFLNTKNTGKNVYILAWSMGAILALKSAVKFCDFVKGIIIVSGTSKFVRDRKKGYDIGWHKLALERMKKGLESDLENTLKEFYKNMFCEDEKKVKKDKEFLHRECELINFNKTNLKAGLDFLIQIDSIDYLDKVKAPVLLIHGREDKICPLEGAVYIAENIASKSYLYILEQCGHVPFYSKIDEFLLLIKHFYDEMENEFMF